MFKAMKTALAILALSLIPTVSQAKLLEIDDPSAIKNSKIPVLLMIYADFCGYCKDLEKVLLQKQPELEGKVLLAKTDAVKNGIPVPAVPAVILFINNEAVYGFLGVNMEELETTLKIALSGGRVPLRPSPGTTEKEARK
jgi:thioredoxin-like negative regulator of GroEL